MHALLTFSLVDHLCRRFPLIGTLMAIVLYIVLGLALFSLVGCGNITRPLPYTDASAPVVPLPAMLGNSITQPPVAANSRIRSGL